MSRTRSIVICALVALSLALLAISGCGVSAYVDSIEYASVDAIGNQGNGASDFAAVSAGGTAVAYQSVADALVADDTNAVSDVFVRNLASMETTRASIASDGTQANAESLAPTISGDGARVAFLSAADNLVAGDLGGRIDAFVRDLSTSTTTLVSVATDGTQANRRSNAPVISSDGGSVVFTSAATNLSADANTIVDVFVRDLDAGTTTLVSVASDGSFGDANSSGPYPNADASVVAFASLAGNLVGDDTNGVQDIFVHDLVTGQTMCVSRPTGGAQANGASQNPSVSADGRFVTFASDATNLVPDDTNGVRDIFLHDRDTGTTTRVSTMADGQQSPLGSFNPHISPDGQFIGFNTVAALESNDTNNRGDVYVLNRSDGQVCRVSWERDQAEGNGASTVASLSSGATRIAFESAATNLGPGDGNGVSDVLVARTDWDSVGPTTTHDAPAGWATTSPVTVTLTPTDAAEPDEGGFAPFGISSVTYVIDGVPTTVSESGFPPVMPTVSFAVTDEGVTTVSFSALDKGGHREATKTVDVQIDTVDPTATSDVQPTYTAPALIALSGSDDTSGIGAVFYELRLDGAAGVPAFLPYTGPISITEPGVYEIAFYAQDVAGNESEIETVSFTVTAAAPPSTDPTPTPAPSGGIPWTGGNYIYIVFAAAVCVVTGVGLRLQANRPR